MRAKNLSLAPIAVALLLLLVPLAQGQEVILDKPVLAGELTLFPSATSPNDYYYVANQSRLAVRNDGTPQFSFLQYVEPDVTADREADRAAGGGIVHALIELGVTDQQLSQARTELRRVNRNGRIVGPVVFQSGTFALVSSFAEAGSDFTDKVLGVGNAPLLENSKAAVSLSLTRKGAEVLWQSFNTPTPDISFSFNMEIDGFRSPRKATIEADFDRIYDHRDVQAGVATPWLQAEIQDTLEDLRSQGAIRITQIGEDENMAALIQTAYDRLTELMFERGSSSGTPAAAALASSGGGTDTALDKASRLLEERRKETREENDAARERNEKVIERRAKAAGTRAMADETRSRITTAESGAEQITQRAANARRIGEAYERRAAAATDETQRNNYRELGNHFNQQSARYERMAEERSNDAKTQKEELAGHESAAAEAESAAGSSGAVEQMQELPSLSIVASYRMKRVRQRGTYRIDLNKYAADTLTLRFDENIGDLRRYLANQTFFRTVDIGNSAFRQREIPVYIDGLNTADFGDYINFVTVLLRKRHEDGTQTTDEVRIDRANFQQTANNFKLSYRKLNDSNLARFLEYDYKVSWNFFGGEEVDEPWKTTSRSGIGLNPPYQKRSVLLDADPELLSQANIRSVEFRLYYKLGDNQQVKRVSLRPRNDQGLSQTVHFMLPEQSYQYEYELNWTMNDGSRKTTGRVRSEDGTVYFDKVAEG